MTAPEALPSAPGDRSELLCRWAIEEGFDRAGVATLEPSEYARSFDAWIERGDHDQMHFLARRRDVRLDPSSRLEGGRSVVCVAFNYDRGEGDGRQGGENDLWRGVARYAQGDDYHDVMLPRLRRLGDRIERSFPGTRTRSYVDTGPLLERELAQRAGLGRIGKNTMLLHRTGSYFLLGEVLTTLELEPASEAVPDLCGQCTRCLEACPTGALPEPFRLDARRCISNWTIEHRGPFDAEQAMSLHGWSFGCDICQEVCPWNSPRNPRRVGTTEAALQRPEQRGALDLVTLATIDRATYVERFRRSPMKRPKRHGLRRNAMSVLAAEGRDSLRRLREHHEWSSETADRFSSVLDVLRINLEAEEDDLRSTAQRLSTRLLDELDDLLHVSESLQGSVAALRAALLGSSRCPSME